MVKKLTAKTQELNPKLPQYSSSFSKCFCIKPETNEILLKKGAVYIVFEISGASNFDTELVSKVVSDVLHDSYYQSEGVSPVQSMEKAISETDTKIRQLSSDTLTSDPKDINLNMICAILWGNVLYVVKFGNGLIYLIKNTDISPMEMVSEGNFSSSSKIVEEDEVLVLCTNAFQESFPPEKLLSSSISEGDLNPDQTCLLMRLLVDASSEEGEIDLGLGDAVSKSQNRENIDKTMKLIKSIAGNFLIAGKKVVKVLTPIYEYLAELFSKIIPKRKALLFTRKVTQISVKKGGKSKGTLFLIIIAILLALSVFFTFKSRIFKESDNEEIAVEIEEQGIENNEVVPEDRSKDQEFKVERVSPEVFYDLKISDSEADPTEIQAVGNRVVIVDRSSGKIYQSEISTPNFKTENNTFPGIKSLAQMNTLLTFNDREGFKTYDLQESKIIDSYTIESINLTYPYSNFVYSISDDILTRSVERNGDLEGELWGQNPDFRGVISMAIAFNVYILKEDGNLVSYSGGKRTDFSVSGLEKSFLSPVKVTTDNNFDNIYVADRGNKSIVVLNKDGGLERQYKNDNDSLWQDIRGVAVSSDEKTIFVLDTSKIYKLEVQD